MRHSPGFGIVSPHRAERKQMISEPVLVAVIFHYEQDGREGRGKETTKSVCLLVTVGVGFREGMGATFEGVTWTKRG